jgi:hypothetical protein
MRAFLAVTKAAAAAVAGLCRAAAEAAVGRNTLPSTDMLVEATRDPESQVHHVHLSLPEPTPPQTVNQGGSLDERRKRAASNLGTLPLMPASTSTAPKPSQVLAYLQRCKGQALGFSLSSQLQLHVVEDAMAQWVANLSAGSGTAQPTAADDSEGEALEALVDRYREVSHAFMATMGTPSSSASPGTPSTPMACMRVERRSREIMVVWGAYCLYDAAVRHKYPWQMRVGGVALLWQDLRHLSVNDRAAQDTVRRIADYLRDHYMPGQCDVYCSNTTCTHLPG